MKKLVLEKLKGYLPFALFLVLCCSLAFTVGCSYPKELIKDSKKFIDRHSEVYANMLKDDSNLKHILPEQSVDSQKLYRDGLLLDLGAYEVEIQKFYELIEE